MRAAVIDELGSAPQPGQVAEPVRGKGQALVEVGAAPLNPVDLAISKGAFYQGTPSPPYVPGKEGVGTVLEGERLAAGTRVYVEAPGGIGGNGTYAERVVVDEATAIALEGAGTQDVEDAVAASLGIAGLAGWLPLEWRAQLRPGETVLVLGASGAVGAVAVQAARLLGAGRVVAAARDPQALARAKDLGADATVSLADSGDLTQAFLDAAGGPVDVVIDPLWGAPAQAALQALGRYGRLVQLGQAAGAEISITSASIRGKTAALLGFTVFQAPQELKQAALTRMCAHAARGELSVEVETVALEHAAQAWQRQAESPHVKLVLVP